MSDFFPPKPLRIDYARELNGEQIEVVLNGDGPCLVLAGAGSGKTRTITYRLAYLIEQGVSPEDILLVTFTNKAAREMGDRVQSLLGGYPTGLWTGTFHSVANRILRSYASLLGFTPSFTILDQEDSQTFIKAAVKNLAVDVKTMRFPTPHVLQSLLSYSRNAMTPIRILIEERHSHFRHFTTLIEDVAEGYRVRKLEANAVDFDDLLLFLRSLLFENPGVRERLSQQFQYILVDEYQDTNRIQADIVTACAGQHHNLLVVGDDAQSIYSFRAAEIRHILDFPKSFPDAKTFRLVTNYRSTPEILTVANSVIGNNKDQFRKELIAVCPSADKPLVLVANNAPDEARQVVSHIQKLKRSGEELSEIAVLFRAAFHSQALEMELIKQGIPYEYRGGLKFFERAHVKDVIVYLRILVNIKDQTAWIRILGHQPGIGLVTAEKILAIIAPFSSLTDVIAADLSSTVPARARAGWEGFTSIAKGILASRQWPADLIRAVASSSYKDYLEVTYPDFQDRLEDLEQLALFAEQYDDITKLLEDIALQSDYEALNEKNVPSSQKIILSTIHQAKGLEWNTVFIVHLVEGSFPNQRALQEQSGIEEERRLFYVAVTRARKRLFLSYPLSAGYDGFDLKTPSMFLQEIPRHLLTEEKKSASLRSSSVYRPHQTDEPIIVFDDLGERTPTVPSLPRSFLRSVEDL